MAGVVVVTGAGSGVGRAVARNLLETGYRVVPAGRRADTLAETATGDDVLVVPTDVSVEESVVALFDATKHAITGITKSLSPEGGRYRIACGQIDIGNAATPLTERMGQGVLRADFTTAPEPTMDVSGVADAVRSTAGLPLEANVQFMTVMATAMPLVGRG